MDALEDRIVKNMDGQKNNSSSIPLPVKYFLLVLLGRVTARILPTHNSLRKNASGPGHPLYLLWL